MISSRPDRPRQGNPPPELLHLAAEFRRCSRSSLILSSCFHQKLHVLHGGDEPVLDVLAPQPPPPAPLEPVFVGGLRKTCLRSMSAAAAGHAGPAGCVRWLYPPPPARPVRAVGRCAWPPPWCSGPASRSPHTRRPPLRIPRCAGGRRRGGVSTPGPRSAAVSKTSRSSFATPTRWDAPELTMSLNPLHLVLCTQPRSVTSALRGAAWIQPGRTCGARGLTFFSSCD